MTIEHIVFDIGKVLIHYDPEIPFKRLIPDENMRQFFFEHICTSAWNIEQDRGREWRHAEDLLITDYPDYEAQIRAFRAHWHEMVPHAYEDNVALLHQLLAAKRDVTMLTNFAPDTFREAEIMFPFLKWTRGVTVSGDVKLIKPDRAIYDLHSKSFDLDPAKTLFIDDSAENCAGAEAYGWQVIHLTKEKALEPELKRFFL